MYFPFSLKSASNWFDFVPEFLLTLPVDSKYVYNKEFHHYLASTLETFFSQASGEFLSNIFAILIEATEAGKYIILETLLFAETIWEALAQDETLQPVLTELALSTDKLYSKSAVNLSSKLEDILLPREEEAISEVVYEKKEEDIFEESVLDDILEGALEEISTEKLETRASLDRDEFLTMAKEAISPEEPDLKAPPPPPKPAPRAPARPTRAAPPTPPPSGAPQAAPSPAPETPPAPAAPVRAAEAYDTRDEEAPVKRKKVLKEEYKEEIEEEPSAPPIITPEVPKAETIHTHVHYYSRMNSRKTYPFTVTLSKIARKIAADKFHFLSGEKEKETRGEFDLPDFTKRLIVEPLLSGCLVQPTSQFVDSRPQNLPKELTFFVTPLVEAGFRSTPLSGSVSVKDEKGIVLLKLDLPELSVASHRVSKVAALTGTVGGGAMPAFDLLFGVNLQVTLANQLTDINPEFGQSFDMLWIVMGAQVLLFTIAVGIALLWWWKKGRAKVAPDRATTIQLSQ